MESLSIICVLRRVLMLLLALAICTAADALLFTAIRGMAQRSELKARNDLLARQIDRQNEHYAALTAQYENLRRIRHDISSHLYTMQLLLQEGQYDEAAAYSAEVTEACRFRSDLGACENPVVGAFLFSRAEELRRFLLENGFSLLAERLVTDGTHLYPVMTAVYTQAPPPADALPIYAGAFSVQEGRPYRQRMAAHLRRRAAGIARAGGDAAEWLRLAGQLEAME